MAATDAVPRTFWDGWGFVAAILMMNHGVGALLYFSGGRRGLGVAVLVQTGHERER